MKRVTKSLKIDPELWKSLKIECVKQEKEISEYVEEAIKDKLKKK